MREHKLSRRDFIGWTVAGAAGLLLPTIARPRAKVFDMGRGPKPKRGSVFPVARSPELLPGDWIYFTSPEGFQEVLVAASDGHLVTVARFAPTPTRIPEGTLGYSPRIHLSRL